MTVRKYRVAPDLRRHAEEHILARADRAPLTKRDLTMLHKHRDQRMLTLIQIESESLDFLAEWSQLQSLIMYGCKVADFTALTRLKHLTHLFYNHYVTNRHKADLSFIAKLKRVEDLGIGNAPHLRSLPDLSKCTRLTRLNIFGCKRLKGIDPVTRIPKLESFSIVNTPQMPRDLEKIMAMKSLKKMSGAFGSREKDAQFRQLLDKHGLVYG
jgi:hypothetical protein